MVLSGICKEKSENNPKLEEPRLGGEIGGQKVSKQFSNVHSTTDVGLSKEPKAK